MTDSGSVPVGATPVIDHARLALACAYAVAAHAGQTRKGTVIAYASHLLGVGAHVLEHGGTTEQAIAGLLHDVVEDQGGVPRLHEVCAVFGEVVAQLVDAVSDAAPNDGQEKAPWLERKQQYLDHLGELVAADSPAVLVSACDWFHNLTAIGHDLDDPNVGTAVFERFNGPDIDATVFNHRSVVEVFTGAPDVLVPSRLKRQLIGALARVEAGANEWHAKQQTKAGR